MKLSDLVTLLEMPQYVNREMPREEPEQLTMSVDAFEREFDLLHKYDITPEAEAGESVAVVIGLAKDHTSAIAGELIKNERENRWYVHIRVNLTFHDSPPASDIPGNVLQVDTVIASPSVKSRGMGYNLYKSLVDKGFSLLSDNVQYVGGRKLWDKIIRKAHEQGYKVYILKGDKLLRGEDGKAINFDGHNIPHDAIWKEPGKGEDRARDQEFYDTLLVATNKTL